jgi:ParB-like chromosome segregation protein Spo0J
MLSSGVGTRRNDHKSFRFTGSGGGYRGRWRHLYIDLRDLEKIPAVRVPIDALQISESPRGTGENPQHVRTLAEVRGPLPPIIVHRDTKCVIDGMHRLRAAQLRGSKEIDVRFVDGNESSCYVLAVKANVTHGLPLSLSDRKAAAERIIKLYPSWSDRMISSVAGIAPKTVAAVRGARADGDDRPADGDARPTGQKKHLDSRIGLDGRRRPQDLAERRELAGKLIRENPAASLREIARKARISPETVRSVRAAILAPVSGMGGPDAVGSEIQKSATDERRSKESFPAGQLDRPSDLEALRSDPAFRSTDIGRSLLRMLSSAEIFNNYGDGLISRIPPHCLDRVARAAWECAHAWQQFAADVDQLKRTQLQAYEFLLQGVQDRHRR